MEHIFSNSWNVVSWILYISLIIFFFQNKKVNSFVKGIFLTSMFFNIIASTFALLMYRFSIESIGSLFGWGEKYQLIPEYFDLMSYFLMLFGLSLLIGRPETGTNEPTEKPAMKGNRRNLGILLLLFAVTLGIYFIFWLYKTIKDLKDNFRDEIPYTPGKAVGFLFIPIFNFYWGPYLLFSLLSKIKRIENKHFGETVGFYFHPVLIPILYILFAVIVNVQILIKFDKETYGGIIYCQSALYVLWLTIQAKLNAFYDFKK